MNGSHCRILALVSLGAIIWDTSLAGFKLDFNRSNQTYDWSTAIGYDFTRAGFSYSGSFAGESNLVKGGLSRWQENATARFASQRNIVKRLSFLGGAEYTVNGLDRRRVRSAELSTGFSYNPVDAVSIRPLLKLDRIHRSDFTRTHQNQGAGYGVEGGLATVRLLGVDYSASASFSKIGLSSIPSSEGSGSFNAVTNLFAQDTLRVSLKGLEAAKKYYSISARNDEVIVKQVKQEREGSFGLAMTLPARLKLRVDGNAHLSRYLYRYPVIDDISAPQKDNYGRGGGYKAALGGLLSDLGKYALGYTWGRTSQDFQGLDLDQQTEIGEFSIRADFWRGGDSLTADIIFGVTSYITPNPNPNRQDRDQKTVLVNGRFLHYFSRFFSAGVSGGANSFHQIYVSGGQSGNNNRNDTYILTPLANWRPLDRMLLSQSFEIQANYITFDYDRKKLATKNRIFRRATARTDVRYTFSEHLMWQQGFLYRYEDYGQLIWDDGWQQAVSWDRRRSGLETRLTYSPGKVLEITPSFSWEKTDDYGHGVKANAESQGLEEIRFLSDEQVKLLFRIEMVLNWSKGRLLRADFSHRTRKFMALSTERTDYATVSLEHQF